MKNQDWNKVLEACSGDLRRLDYVTRYSSIPVTYSETVSSHQYWVTIYSCLIHQELMPGDKKLVGPVLLKASIHDTQECITGDLIRTFKYSSKTLKDAIDEAEKNIMNKLPDRISSLFSLYEDMFREKDESVHELPDYVYVEAIVKAGDFLSLQQYMNREWLRGNREIEPFFQRMTDDLHMMANKMANSEETRVRGLEGLYLKMVATSKSPKFFTA